MREGFSLFKIYLMINVFIINILFLIELSVAQIYGAQCDISTHVCSWPDWVRVGGSPVSLDSECLCLGSS